MDDLLADMSKVFHTSIAVSSDGVRVGELLPTATCCCSLVERFTCNNVTDIVHYLERFHLEVSFAARFKMVYQFVELMKCTQNCVNV